MMAGSISILEQQVGSTGKESVSTKRLRAALEENSVLFYVEKAPRKTLSSKCRLIECSEPIENGAYQIAIQPHFDIPGSAWSRGRL